MTIEFSSSFAQNIPAEFHQQAILDTVEALCKSAIRISDICARGPLEDAFGAVAGTENSDGDTQKALDVQSDEIIIAALKTVPVAFYASEERDDIIILDKTKPLAVASDPLDGSSNVDTNVSIGTIFSVYDAKGESPEASFFRPGTDQMVGGFFIYGPQTTLVITAGEGTELYVLERKSRVFKLAIPKMQIAETSHEFAINASNYEHWEQPMRDYINDCLKGADGPFKKKQGMRWVGSLVADANRILMRGGIFAYPADAREGYEQGRLRLLYEAHPVAFVIEQAGGMATDGHEAILDKTLTKLHERVPFIFGSVDTVQTIVDYHKKK